MMSLELVRLAQRCLCNFSFSKFLQMSHVTGFWSPYIISELDDIVFASESAREGRCPISLCITWHPVPFVGRSFLNCRPFDSQV